MNAHGSKLSLWCPAHQRTSPEEMKFMSFYLQSHWTLILPHQKKRRKNFDKHKELERAILSIPLFLMTTQAVKKCVVVYHLLV